MLVILLLCSLRSFTNGLTSNDIYNELSWPVRLKLIQEFLIDLTQIRITTTPAPMDYETEAFYIAERRVNTVEQRLNTARQRLNMAEQRLNMAARNSRRVGIAALVNWDKQTVMKRQNEMRAPPQYTTEMSADESKMRLKLFRMMYETVRDSDVKVKRAELIQENYSNMTSFQIGYLMGDVTDKHSTMTDIATTLARFHNIWKPIEHINAYEQIANQAIEISHLIDLMRVAIKNEVSTTPSDAT